MTNSDQQYRRPTALVAIVLYKSFEVALFAITSITLLIAAKNAPFIKAYANEYVLEGRREVIKFILIKFLNLHSKTLEFSGIASGFYAILTAIEAVGLWYQKKWASLLVIGLVGLSIPLEILELIKKFSLIKLIVFVVNLAVLWYVLREFLKAKNRG